ncbi:crossover junction endodeoxyribonuclease RuvC [Kineococcus xinjiangensis]|uniref:Crossover junction endodeoxyribonuclease RuvC n=1 Tax=Kineococcus xinjiangensis TaxID=512762 RepID=A0A2S6INY7_9ACTN|nr:crossover junction endodeoxyribonuclease RuvC [Kineococcus xinjiangensis]PPK95963.1 crossover junction endodeoxyribonuclease RuvC [Kineococcus xinjiangensis]
MRVLAVDPGLTRCGLAVVDGTGGSRATMVAVGVVRTPAADPVAQRLLAVSEGLEEWLDEHAPDVVAVERVFAQANVRSVMGTAQAAGLVLVAAARRGLPVATHTPSEVKAAVSGNGRAEKAQVAAMVTRILGLAEAPRPADATDALALALCHLWRGGASTRLEAAAHAALVTGRRNGYAEAVRAARGRRS